MIIPVGRINSDQNLIQVDKQLDGTIKQENLMGVLYVALTDREVQWPKDGR